MDFTEWRVIQSSTPYLFIDTQLSTTTTKKTAKPHSDLCSSVWHSEDPTPLLNSHPLQKQDLINFVDFNPLISSFSLSHSIFYHLFHFCVSSSHFDPHWKYIWRRIFGVLSLQCNSLIEIWWIRCKLVQFIKVIYLKSLWVFFFWWGFSGFW